MPGPDPHADTSADYEQFEQALLAQNRDAAGVDTADVDGFLTDEFGGTNFALIHAVLPGPQIVPSPRLICDYARNGHMTDSDARMLLVMISRYRKWGVSPYVAQLRDRLE